MGYPAPSTIVVDLSSTKAVDIACRLGSLVNFLEAAEELQTCDSLSSFAFRRHSRKVCRARFFCIARLGCLPNNVPLADNFLGRGDMLFLVSLLLLFLTSV
jgi:hypothetical protein